MPELKKIGVPNHALVTPHLLIMDATALKGYALVTPHLLIMDATALKAMS